ncbi:hypothetical protein [Nocardiopsis aegyptia]|uniref:Uncharacterized protein n=1 Tax=Nocardiopsis aegyptia TaxID=220378 RepID=A0A7Z0JCB1_9ACTN|nr:hypothetical protein [Nocardiopsis aegyptia]NYJ36782.1 hypothetical protein [Nocardiopsis aegyptia]
MPTAHPWDGTASRTAGNVLARESSENEGFGIRVVPGAAVVSTIDSGTITSAAVVT